MKLSDYVRSKQGLDDSGNVVLTMPASEYDRLILQIEEMEEALDINAEAMAQMIEMHLKEMEDMLRKLQALTS